MKWLKFREAWAYGFSNWKYRPLYITKLLEEDRAEIKEEMEELEREFQPSDNFRGIEWEIVDTKQVPNKHIEAACVGVKKSIRWYLQAARDAKKRFPKLNAQRGKGRKTCPDEIRHAKAKKLQQEALKRKPYY